MSDKRRNEEASSVAIFRQTMAARKRIFMTGKDVSG